VDVTNVHLTSIVLSPFLFQLVMYTSLPLSVFGSDQLLIVNSSVTDQQLNMLEMTSWKE